MPEIKNTFVRGKMNKDLDERLIPNGEYREALNVEISTSEDSNVGTVQNVIGNKRIDKLFNGNFAISSNDFTCIGSIADEKENKLYWFITSVDKDIILEWDEENQYSSLVFVDTKKKVKGATLKFPSKTITGINIVDEFLMWTDGVNEPKKINIKNCKLGTTSVNQHTLLYVNGTSVGDIEEEHITVIKKRPSTAPFIKINHTDSVEEKSLFENVFPRFTYRYKYADGEYSAFGPFTAPIISAKYSKAYNSSNFYDIKEGYNTAMYNTIKSLEIMDFVPHDIPKDVVQVDILYKQDDSNVVYSIAKIKNTDPEFSAKGSGLGVQLLQPIDDINRYRNLGKYVLNTENIYAAVPENQLLRVYDNVPKKAIAQEIVGNRLVYANYTQGYDIDQDIKVYAGYEKRNVRESFETGGIKSVKSQRDYQVGIVFGDEYGRETPVITSSEGSIKIPFTDDDIVNGVVSTKAINIKAKMSSYAPDWASYFKFYVKETSGEYYNALMTAAFIPGSDTEFDNKEEHLWLTFNSSDINKIQEDSYLVLKRTIGANGGTINYENKYKVIDVKAEAPESIAYNYFDLCSQLNNNLQLNDGGTDGSIMQEHQFRIDQTVDKIKIDVDSYLALGHSPIPSSDGENASTETSNNIYISWKLEDANDSTFTHSKKYKVSSVSTVSGAYVLGLANKITPGDAKLASNATNKAINTATGSLDENLTFLVERKDKREGEDFSGKFFVKIKIDELILQALVNKQVEVHNNKFISSSANVLWLASIQDSSNELNGVLNTNPYANTPDTTVQELIDAAANELADASSHWSDILGETGPTFFIDNMYLTDSNPSDSYYAKEAGQGWRGNPVSYPKAVWNNTTDIPWSPDVISTEQQYDEDNFSASNVMNGLPGIVTTNTSYIEEGSKQWKQDSIFDVSFEDSYGEETGKVFMHISFLAPGKNLHSSNWTDNSGLATSTATGLQSLAKDMQGIWGGGVFIKEGVYVEFEGNYDQTDSAIGMPAPGPGIGKGYDLNYRELHERQWDPTFNVNGDPDGVIKEFIENIKIGSKFKFSDDTTNDLYTILNVNVKRVYNHTSWRTRHQHVAGLPYLDGKSVEEKALAWADDTTDVANGDALKAAIEAFGKANNRRVCYIIELDKDPTGASSSFNPVQGGSDFPDAVTPTTIEFVDEKTQALSALKINTPAVFETKPKQSADLNIFYEASQAIPLLLDVDSAEMFCPRGCRVEFPNLPAARHGKKQITQNVYVRQWNLEGDQLHFLVRHENNAETFGLNYLNANQDIIDYSNQEVRFYRPDGGYTTAIIGQSYENQQNEFDAGYRVAFNVSKFVDTSVDFGLSWNNCISFGNGIESNRIRDDFNAPFILNGARASSTIEEPYSEESRKYGLIYSGIYNSTNGVNNLNQFIQAEKITKDVNPTYGSIQKLYTRDSDLVAFCEDKVLRILANKDAIFNADGNPQLVATENVLGQVNPFVGDFGISKNPESFAKESYRAYFADKQRRAILRLSMDGLTPISDAGMKDFFRDNMLNAGKILGTYDEYKKQYNVTILNPSFNNVLANSYISEGVDVTPVTSTNEIVENAALNGGVDYNFGGAVSDYYSQYQYLNNTGFSAEATITYFPAINAEFYQQFVQGQEAITAVAGQVGIEGQDAAFPEFFTNSGSAGERMFSYRQNIDGNPFLSSGSGYSSGFDGQFQRFYSDTYSQFIPADSTSNPTGVFLVGETGVEQSWGGLLDVNFNRIFWSDEADNLFISTGFGDRNYNYYPGINFTYDNPDQSVLGGILLPGNVISGDTIPNDYVAAPVLAANPTATNMTIFNGEEIKIVVYYGTNIASYSDNEPEIQIRLRDGATGNFVGNSILRDSSDIPNSAPVGFETATNTNPYTTFMYPEQTAGDSTGQVVLGYQANNAVYTTVPLAQNSTGIDTNSVSVQYKFVQSMEPTVVVDNLQIDIRVDLNNLEDTLVINRVEIYKTSAIQDLGQSFVQGQAQIDPVTGQPFIQAAEAVPGVYGNPNSGNGNQLAFTAVDYAIDGGGWTFNIGSLGTINPFYGAQDYYGSINLPTLSEAVSLNNGTTAQWYIGNDNGVSSGTMGVANTAITEFDGVTLNQGNVLQGTDEITTAQNKVHVMHPGGSTGSGIIAQDITSDTALVHGNWYLIDVEYTPSLNPGFELNNYGYGIYIQNVFQPFDADTSSLTSGVQHEDSSIPGASAALPNGYIGRANHYMDGLRLVPMETGEYGGGTHAFRGVFQFDEDSQMGTDNAVRIQFYSIELVVNRINFIDITLPENNSSIPEGWLANALPSTQPVHALQENRAYYANGGYNWNIPASFVDAEDNTFKYIFNADEVDFFEESYTFSFTFDNIGPLSADQFSGSFRAGFVSNINESGESVRFVIDNINEPGLYTFSVDFSNNSFITVNTPEGFTGDASLTVDASATVTNSNRLYFYPIEATGGVGKLENASVQANTNLFTGGSIESWSFGGFNASESPEVFFEDGQIEFDTVQSTNAYVSQALAEEIPSGQQYNLDIDYSITSGFIDVYYYNTEGQGFTVRIGDDDAEVYSTNFNNTLTIGDEVLIEGSADLVNTLVLKPSPNTQALISGIKFKRVNANVAAVQTLSYSEDVKGWVSFKSFIPESGLSLSKNYYTLKDGKLYKHYHAEAGINTFYNQNPEPSSVVAVFNDSPSIVKNFKTINYEGTSGWNLDYIYTNIESGSINSFVEKENKYFNYIKGEFQTNDVIDASGFNVQGLGIASLVTSSSEEAPE